jgi:hypothetical protein
MQCISLWSKYATNLRYLGLDKQSLFARPVIAIDWSIPSQLMESMSRKFSEKTGSGSLVLKR